MIKKEVKMLMPDIAIYFLPIFLFRKTVIEAFEMRMLDFQNLCYWWLAS